MTDGSDLYEDVRSAFSSAEELQDEPAPAPVASEAEGDDESIESTVRDEAGRFAKKDKAEADEPVPEPVAKEGDPSATEAPAPTDPVALSAEKAPQSWTPAAREKWASIDPDIRNEIIRREEASANGVRQMQERFAPMQRFIEQMQPVAQEAQAVGQSPDQYIYSLAQSERTLRGAELPAKFNEILRIADQYGIPLREIINKSVGDEVIKAPQQGQAQSEVQQELQAMRQWREQQQYEQVERDRADITHRLAEFSKDKEFLEDVRLTMADLIERGLANTVPEAYDKACWMVPEVRQVMLSRQGQQRVADSVAERQGKAAGASLKASGKVAVPDGDEADDDIAETVRKAWSASAGRV